MNLHRSLHLEFKVHMPFPTNLFVSHSVSVSAPLRIVLLSVKITLPTVSFN